MLMTRRQLMRSAAGSLLWNTCAPLAARAQPGPAGNLLEVPGDHGRRLRAARIRALHLHNQPTGGPLHETLLELWDRLFEATGGELLVTPLPLDANLPGSDAEAVNRTADGTFQLVSVAAPIIDALVPDIGLQSMPFVYRSSWDVLALVNTDAFGDLLQQGLAGSNLVYLPRGTFSNGMRVTTTRADRPLRSLGDFAGLRIRIPPSLDVREVMTALGAQPVVAPIGDTHEAIASGKVEAQENPPTVIEAFRLYEVVHWINLTNHLWSGFNTLANAGFWQRLPARIREAIIGELPAYQTRQVERQEKSNSDIIETFKKTHGMDVMATDTHGAQQRMIPIYRSMYSRFSPAGRRLAEPLISQFLGR